MKRVFVEFFHLCGNCILGFALVFASFLLMINLYHSKEIATITTFSMKDYKLYTDFKESVENAEDIIANFRPNFVSNDSQVNYQLAKDLLTYCVSAVKESAFYQLDSKSNYSSYDIYLLNQDLDGSINSQCLYSFEVTLAKQLEKIGYDRVSYDPISKDITIIRNHLNFTTTYMRDRLLSNSMYHYTTDVTRTTIFDENRDQLFMIVDNYGRITNALDLVVDWYLAEFGGNQ